MAIGQYIELWSLIAKHGAHAQPRRHSFGNGPRTSATRRRRRTGPSFLVNAPSHVPSNYATEQLQSPPRCKFFIWSVLLGRCWTPHRLQQHGLQNSGPCALCLQMSETIHHLLLTCVFSKKVWFRLLRRVGFQVLTPGQDCYLAEWIASRKRVHKD
jgi:hypothetical protein